MLDEDGEANPIISWSDLHVLYQLPDGSKWAEHGNFYDCEDLVSCPVCIVCILVQGLYCYLHSKDCTVFSKHTACREEVICISLLDRHLGAGLVKSTCIAFICGRCRECVM